MNHDDIEFIRHLECYAYNLLMNNEFDLRSRISQINYDVNSKREMIK